VIPTGSFAHRSPMASRPHDPLLCLASHCLRTAFGESVQMVADALQSTGQHVTLKQLWTTLYRVSQQQQTITSDNNNVLSGGIASSSNMSPMNNKKALRIKEESIVRASLLVLIQHSIVTMKRQRLPSPSGSSGSKRALSASLQPPIYLYQYHPERAIRLSRYAKYIEYIKKALDLTAAGVVETLLLHGRCRTIDLVVRTVEQCPTLPQHDRYTARETVVDAMAKLATGGFLERVLPFVDENDNDDDSDEDDDENAGETEFEPKSKSTKEPPTKRVRLSAPPSAAEATAASMPTSWKDLHHEDQQEEDSEDPAVLKLIKSHAHYKDALPVDAVWRVNQTMFHHSSRAYCLGRMVGQLVGHSVQAAGSFVTAALKYRAHLEHVVQHPANTLVLQTAAAAAAGSSNTSGGASAADHGGGAGATAASNAGSDARQSYNVTFFTARDIVKYLPKTVLQVMEKKKSSASAAGGGGCGASNNANVVRCIHQALVELAEQNEKKDPVIVRRVGDDRFEIAHASLTDFLRRRIIHQVILDRHGEVAARIVSILSKQGWLESETLADFVMVQAKDTRSMLHELYRSRYIELFLLAASSGGRQPHNPATAIYLWSVHKDRLLSNVTQDVAMSCWNIRLRRQHESQIIGKDWIERAQQAHEMDENEHERDKINSLKFCAGLERLDVALQQLDETLMVLCDF
jgi:hypothetical protein